MKKKNLFDKVIKAATAAGANARITAIGAGLYHDGKQHGEIIDIVFVSIDRYKYGHYNGNSTRIAQEARKAISRVKGTTIKEVSHPGFYIYQVYTTADAERAEALQKEANIFLEAFHQEHHRQNAAGEKLDTDKAIASGHEALKAAGYTKEAA